MTDVAALRQQQLARFNVLEREARQHVPLWQEIDSHFAPGSYRRTRAERLKAPLLDAEILDTTGQIARRAAEAGMTSGLTSPSRPWMKLATSDSDLNRFKPVETWLDLASRIMLRTFSRSNTYQSLPSMFGCMAAHGTACMLTEADARDVMRTYVWPIGSFFAANGARGSVDTVYRKSQLTVAQLVESFAWESLSTRVRQLWTRKSYDEWIDVVRCVEPNVDRDPFKLDSSNFETRSTWFELGGDQDKLLRRSGYHEFPLQVPRWDVVGEDVYGRGLGAAALPDSRELQHSTRREGQLIDALTQPALSGPSSVSSTYPLPGEVQPVPAASSGNQMGAIYQPPPQALQIMDARAQRLQRKVEQVWFADLWLAVSNDDRAQRATAREIAERHEEKLLQLGPQLERTYQELLNPFVEVAFWIHWRAGKFPPPPDELINAQLRVEHLSPLAVAQRLVGITSLERMAGFVGNLSGAVPSVLEKMDWDGMVEEYAERISITPSLVLEQDVVDERRAAKQEAARQQQMITEQGPAAADTAKVLSETDAGGDSALNRLLYATGSAPGVPAVLPGANQ